MTVAAEGDTPKGTLYSIQDTKDRGRAVYASDRIPTGTTVHVASKPYVSVIKEQFKKEVCAWCFKYHHGKTCPIKHSDGRTGVWFCSTDCLQNWTDGDYDGRLAEALTSLRTNAARKQASVSDTFPFDQSKLVASAIAERSQEKAKATDMSSWNQVLDLQSAVYDDEIDLATEVTQIVPFLMQNLPSDLRHLVESTAYPFLSRHLSNSFGIWELPITPDSENLGSAMYPSASYFNHSCDPNVMKVRLGREVLFVTCRDVQVAEELCISYGDTERLVEERRHMLRDWWGFNCNCNRCKRELGVGIVQN